MERVIQGFLAASRTRTSQEEDNVLGDTLELSREVRVLLGRQQGQSKSFNN